MAEQGFQGYTGFQLQSDRHFRALWELPESESLGADNKYAPLYNGGEYRRFRLPRVHAVRIGGYLGFGSENFPSYSYRLQNKSYQFLPGVGFGKRGDYVDAHLVDGETVFTVEGQVIPIETDSDRYCLLGFINSSAFQWLINSICGQHKYSGYMNLVPFPPALLESDLARMAEEAYSLKEYWQSQKETDSHFLGPILAFASISDFANVGNLLDQDTEKLTNLESAMNHCVNERLGLSERDVQELSKYSDSIPRGSLTTEENVSIQELAFERLQYCIGIVFGRWSREHATTLSGS